MERPAGFSSEKQPADLFGSPRKQESTVEASPKRIGLVEFVNLFSGTGIITPRKSIRKQVRSVGLVITMPLLGRADPLLASGGLSQHLPHDVERRLAAGPQR